jgi:hypothetical protein
MRMARSAMGLGPGGASVIAAASSLELTKASTAGKVDRAGQRSSQ